MASETSPGVLPATPNFDLIRTSGESLVFSPTTSDSAEIGGGGRFRRPSNVTGQSISGDISFELAPAVWLDKAIAAVLAAQWGQCPLTGAVGGAIDKAGRITVGKTLQTFTIEKRFPNPGTTAGNVPTTVALGPTGAQTITITFAGGAPVGSGVAVIDLSVSGVKYRVNVPINPTDTVTQIGAAAVTALKKAFSSTPAVAITAAAGVVTVDVGAGSTITTAAGRAGSDNFIYQRFKGATFSAMTINIAPNAPVTGSFSVVGGTPELDSLPIPGATYVPAGNKAVFTSPQVLELTAGGMTVGTRCWTSLTISIDSQNRGIPCIGSSGDREVVLGTLSANMSGNVYFSGDQSVLEALLNNDDLGDAHVTLMNAAKSIMRFDMFDVKPTSGQLSAGGAGQDLVVPLTLEPAPKTVCISGTDQWQSGLIISKENTKPTLPTPIIITSDPVASDADVIHVSGGPADAAETATFTYQINGLGANKTFTVNIAKGDTVADVLAAIGVAAKAAGVAGELDADAATADTINLKIGTATSLDIMIVAVV